MKIIYSFWRNGSGGFGFGVWRSCHYRNGNPIWTIALGPLSIYLRKLEKWE
jgi:hypothetical protein